MSVKVFIIIDHLGAGGAQRQVIEYLKNADREKFEISIVNLDKGYAPVQGEIEALGYEVVGIRHTGFLNFSTLKTLVDLFKEKKPDIVYTYLFTADCYGRLAAKMSGVTSIICAIRADDIWKKWHHIFVDRILAKITDVITVNAEALKNYLQNVEKLSADKIRTIYNGIDLRRFEAGGLKFEVRERLKKELGIKDDALVVGMVGRMSAQKDYKTFFEAAKIVEREISNVYFVAVGEGQERKVLELRVSELNELKDKVVFAGHRKDTDQLISIFDVGVLSSHYEGCPNVILEYMACFKPVVASDVGGCKELVVEGETGYIVSQKDPQSLAEKLLILLKDEKLRKNMGVVGRKRVEENFTSDVMAKKTEDLFLELLRAKKG